MIPIPLKLRRDMTADPFYRKCCLSGPHEGRVTWAHVYRYAGKRIQEKWNIIPVCEQEHLMEEHIKGNKSKHDEMCRIVLSRATPEDLVKYSKKNWFHEKERLGIK